MFYFIFFFYATFALHYTLYRDIATLTTSLKYGFGFKCKCKIVENIKSLMKKMDIMCPIDINVVDIFGILDYGTYTEWMDTENTYGNMKGRNEVKFFFSLVNRIMQ